MPNDTSKPNFIKKCWQYWESTAAQVSDETTARIKSMEQNIGLPVKLMIIGLLIYYLFLQGESWFEDLNDLRKIALQMIKQVFVYYLCINIVVGMFLATLNRFPFRFVQWVVLVSGIVDALFLAAIMLITGGYDSVLYWGFVALILRNSVSLSHPSLQIIANGSMIISYIISGFLDIIICKWELEYSDLYEQIISDESVSAEPFFLRVFLLIIIASCSFGILYIFDQQRKELEEAREFAKRQEQLRTNGRLAAEIAHQLKNPLSIINNASFTLQRTVKQGKTITQQIKIIREEVDRSDRILTELMGYAQLSEGRVERIDVKDVLDSAIDQVFPQAAQFDVSIHCNFAQALPSLLAQRNHISEIFVNLLQNSREALAGKGNIWISTKFSHPYSVIIEVSDDGPGIPSEKCKFIFEPYYTTKENGSGLGLAIVKHNTELYNGTVEVESTNGRGTLFTLRFPARTMVNIQR
jgi:signal transduction histidine kinase